MARTMTPEEYRDFLMKGTRTAKVATAGPNGQTHVVPVWFVLDGDTVVFTTGESTVKGKHLRRDPRVSLCVDEEIVPFAFVSIEGTAETIHNAPDLLEWATRLARRYMGPERAEAFGKRNAVEGELLVRVTPRKIIAIKDLSD